ncbi:MAG: amidohydrolase family protein [Alphaproteobacteria bacterium]|nr:amidohydrolase family protein [Alphaproteobacteria bacterium]
MSSIEIGEEAISRFSQAAMPIPAPATTRDRGLGPFKRMVLRGATVIDGTGAPPWGTVDIVVEGGKIAEIRRVGTPGMPLKAAGRPDGGEHEIDCHGKFVTPGFVDCHGQSGVAYHASVGPQPPADYVYKLWLAHGVTTVREAGSLNGLAFTLDQKRRAAEGSIAAPNLVVHSYFPAVPDMMKTIHTPADARAWVRAIKAKGADGIKFFGAPPNIMEAALDEAREQGLRSCCHHAQLAVSRMNALTSARWGLTSAEHYYGLPEALFEKTTIQAFPDHYNYGDEYHRFSVAGQMFQQAAQPGSQKWNDTLDAFIETGFTFVPTFNIYEASRDAMRARRADWHDRYTHDTVWKFYQPSRGAHGSYLTKWTTQNELDWKRHYLLWMQFINDYKNRGGRVCAGSDSGFIFQLYGFGLMREFELLQEAGFNPLEVLRAATSHGAELLGVGDVTGTLEVGKRADILIHDENPLADFKMLYGTGAMRMNETTGAADWTHCLSTTIKDGMVFDTRELLADVEAMVKDSKG